MVILTMSLCTFRKMYKKNTKYNILYTFIYKNMKNVHYKHVLANIAINTSFYNCKV